MVYSIVLFCLLMHVDVDIDIQLHCRVPSTMACTRHVPEIPLKKPLEILKFSHEIANSQGSCLGQLRLQHVTSLDCLQLLLSDGSLLQL